MNIAETRAPQDGRISLMLFRFEVNVGGAALDGVRQQRRDESHHRLRVGVARGLQALVVDFARLDLVQDAVDREVVTVVLVDGTDDFALAREPGLERKLTPQLGPHLVEGDNVVGVGQRDDELARIAVERHRKDIVALGEVARHELEGHRVDHDLREVHALQPELLGERVAQRRLGHETEIDEELADRLMGLELLEKRDSKLVFGEDPLRNQDLPDVALRLGSNGLNGKARGVHGRITCPVPGRARAR